MPPVQEFIPDRDAVRVCYHPAIVGDPGPRAMVTSARYEHSLCVNCLWAVATGQPVTVINESDPRWAQPGRRGTTWFVTGPITVAVAKVAAGGSS